MAVKDVNEAIGKMTKSKSSSLSNRINDEKIEASERARNKIKLMYLKKFGAEQEKWNEKQIKTYEQAIARMQKKLNKQTLDDKKAMYDEEAKYAGTVAERVKASFTKNAIESIQQLGKTAANLVGSAVSGAMRSVDDYIGTYSKYMSGIEARLQGSNLSYSSISSRISTNLMASPYVSQKAMLENLNNLVKSGIAYNVEYRAFLQTIKEDIADTFDAANGTLLRLIRIQQADSTASRLGLEAFMTRFLNANYMDTSYLNSLSKTVSSNLLEASSQMGTSQSLAFESSIQKWLGSLSSVGVSESAISSISQGLGYLGSGNVTALSGNSALQNLIVMAASRAGLNYGELATGGLNANTSNKLLYSLVSFAREIAGTNNEVLKSQYAALFGLTVSDVTAMLNLTADQLNKISNTVINESNLQAELKYQVSQIPSRLSMQERIDNALSNVMGAAGNIIANNPALYVTYQLASLIENAGGLKIPTPFVGSIDLANLTKMGIVGVTTLTQAGAILNGLFGNGGLDVNPSTWNALGTLTGGGRRQVLSTNVSRTTSESSYIGSNSESDFYQESLAAKEESTTKLTGSSESELETILKEETNPNVRTIMLTVNAIEELLRNRLPIGGLYV